MVERKNMFDDMLYFYEKTQKKCVKTPKIPFAFLENNHYNEIQASLDLHKL